jgi:diguanylate cyclase (GGDEF)-like protein/PAS domain S-box-containing protein
MDVAEKAACSQALHSRNAAITGHWYRALATTGYVAHSTEEVRARLAIFVERATTLLLADTFDDTEAQALGADIAQLYYGHPEALSRTQLVLATELGQALPLQQRSELTPRLVAVISELAAGFIQRSRQILLDEQESIRGALMTARQQAQDALHASEARFHAVFDAAAIGIGVGDVEGRILDVNAALLQMLGYTAEEMRQLTVTQFIHPEDAVSVWLLYRELVEGEQDYFQTEKRYFRKDGDTIWCNLTVSLIRDADGIPRLQIAMMENITERKRAEEGLQRSEARFRALVQNALDIVTILGEDGTIIYESPAISHALGFQPEEMVGVDAFSLVHPDDLAHVRRRFKVALRRPGANVNVEFRFRHKNGSWRWLEATGTNLLTEPAVGGIVVNSRDVTEAREISGQLWHQAHHDPLTGLANRVLFKDRLGQALDAADAASVAVISADLDGFKVVNDSLGHEYGDRLLMAVAGRLSSYLGDAHLLARFGGDEFMILLNRVTGREQVSRMADGLHVALTEPFMLDGHTLAVSASLGIVIPTAELASSSDLLRAADVALYRAKAKGKGSSAFFDPDRDAPAFVQLHRETELRAALERGELRLYYQPQINLVSGEVFGIEALVRWQHPTRGLLAPSAFIELAEETGLIVPLGTWVIEEACRQVMSWREESPGIDAINLYVNVSPLQFRDPAFIEQVERVLRETGFPPERLVLEITEQGLLEDTAATERTITQLQGLGVQLAIDDFGAYQAGLGYLRRWPIENLKLDRSLVAELDRNERSRAIVAAVLGLGESLGMKVIAEGIETAGQLAALRQLGCTAGQGYAFAPPLPPDALAAFITSENTTAS